MPYGICKLCEQQGELQLSHIIPAFVFRWLRETSASGHIRSSAQPNVRVQDGLKEHWLCTSCEGILSISETAFATRLFHPYARGEPVRMQYGRWLMLFCISISWRVLRYFRENTSLADFSSSALQKVYQAEAAWRNVLLGKLPNPGQFEVHMLPFELIHSHSFEALPGNINRYLLRAVDIDLLYGGKTTLVYAKLGRFAIFGFIDKPAEKQWIGTKVHGMEGTLGGRDYALPMPLIEYLSDRARHVATIKNQISKRQMQKIEESFLSDPERVLSSGLFEAMQQDVSLFGSDAFSADSDAKSNK